ncbi:MAG: TonB-dependent receptor [Vicinamibacterales bacterium]
MVLTRGFFGGGEADYVQLLVDGAPAHDSESGLADWQRVRSWSTELVEARRGPSSSLYGDGSLGGVVQVFTRRGPYAGGSISKGNLGQLAFDGGAAGRFGPIAAGATATASASQGFRSHSTATQRGATLFVDRSAGHGWTARASTERRHQDDPGPRTARELVEDRLGSDPMFRFDRETVRRARASAGYVRTGESFLFAVDGYTGWRDSDRTRTLLLIPGVGSRVARNVATISAGSHLQLQTQTLRDGTGRVGLELGTDRVRSTYHPVSDQGAAESNVGRMDGRRSKVGVYATQSVNLGQNARIAGGIRWDRVADRFDAATSGTSVRQAWSPRLGMTYRLHGGEASSSSLYAQVAKSFKAATVDQLFDPRPFPNFDGGSFVISNPALEPQRATNLEAGIRHDRATGRVELVGYRMTVANEIDFDPSTFTYGNIGRTRHTGVEAEARWRELSVAYTWTRVQATTRPGHQLKNIPRHILRPTVHVQLPWDLRATGAYTRTWRTFADDANLVQLGDRASLDLRLTRGFGPVRASVDALNVSGDRSEEVGFTLMDFQRNVVPYFFPGAGFSARMSIEVRF